LKTLHVTRTGSLRDPNPDTRGQVKVLDVPETPLGDEDIRIKVAYCSICGSDPHLIEGIFGLPTPFGFGHEVSGIITEVGKKAVKKGHKIGDRVAGNFLHFCGTCYYCQNGQQQFCEHADESNHPGYAENLVWHEAQAYRLPDNVSLRSGCLLEPVSVAVRIADKIAPKIGQRVLISGTGPIGLLVTQAIKMMGAVSLTISEPNAARRKLAEELGADYTIDPTKEKIRDAADRITGGLGYDVVIDCSGSVHAVYDLPYVTSFGGLLLYAAMYPNDFEMPLNLYKICYKNEITITGTYVSPYTFPRALQLLPRFNLKPFTDTVFTLDEAEAAFAAQVTGEHVKILINPNPDIADL